ncbi:hypothetical protein S40285_09377 [Stachybotrys chlorohalonatus IBT 40285]|uniref:CWH43-like N-terminal domain-containing protein n=1 Tax=Stachybotrys chlorohalonatus (strain IBT 40285) TaxID=1283841 RepID=A0A084QZ90_STAC4|nr:hypothetical protein S40285_09377 [Stachybotrys chlorohalonata IBT 40285]
MALRGIFSYWMLPVISGLAWLATLLSLLLFWIFHDDREVYETMEDGQTLPYISDIGATELQPLFITGCVLTSVFLDLAFISERWLRHNGRLIANGSRREKVFSGISIFFAFVGTVGLILLAVFDTRSHPTLHLMCLGLFILGYIVSAIFICWEYRRLGVNNREYSILSTSFWIKLVFILVEFGLVVGFMVSMRTGNSDAAAVLEWVVSFVFTFYAISFVVDLWPAVRTKNNGSRFAKPNEMEEAAGHGYSYPPAASSETNRQMNF